MDSGTELKLPKLSILRLDSGFQELIEMFTVCTSCAFRTLA